MCKSILRCFDNSEPPIKRTSKSRMAIVRFIHFVSQSIKLSHWHPEVNFESPVIIPLLLNKEGELSFLSISQDWIDPICIFFFSLFLRSDRTTKSSPLLGDSIEYCWVTFFFSQLINSYASSVQVFCEWCIFRITKTKNAHENFGLSVQWP